MAWSARTADPAQRPLARQQVMLSCRVIAYYGLIRGSGNLPPTFLAGIRRVFASSGWLPERPCFPLRVLLAVPPSLPRRTGRDRLLGTPARSSLRLKTSGSASAIIHAKVGSRVGRLSGLQSSLYAAARSVACLSPTKAFTFELSCLESPQCTSSITTRANSQFPRPDFHRLDTQPYRLRRLRVFSSPRLLQSASSSLNCS